MPRHGPAQGLTPDKYLTPGELAQVTEYARARAARRKSKSARTDHLAIEILARSGLRAGELVATDDHPDRFLRIRDLPCHHGKMCLFVRDSKSSRPRTVIVPESLAELIAAYVRDYRAHSPATAPLLEARTGRPMCYRTLLRKVRRIGEEMGLPHALKCHCLRHSYAVSLYGVEHDLRLVQQQLGHKDPETTTIYAQTLPESARRQIEALG